MKAADMLVAARGGRVVSSGFLEPDEAAALAAELRGQNLGVRLDGGYEGALRRVLTVYPEHVPYADAPLAALYFAGVHDEDALRFALRRAGLPSEALGDCLKHQEGLSIVVLKAWRDKALELKNVHGRQVAAHEVDLERLSAKTAKTMTVIVPALRVDVLGAKAFRVSRAYFSKGVQGGKVRVKGKPAGKASIAEVGDEVYAEGLGRFSVLEVQGETRKGNLKVVLRVEQV